MMTVLLVTLALWLLVLGLARPAIRQADLIPEEMGFSTLWLAQCVLFGVFGAFAAAVAVPLPEGAFIVVAAIVLAIELSTFMVVLQMAPWFKPIGRVNFSLLRRRRRLRNKDR